VVARHPNNLQKLFSVVPSGFLGTKYLLNILIALNTVESSTPYQVVHFTYGIKHPNKSIRVCFNEPSLKRNLDFVIYSSGDICEIKNVVIFGTTLCFVGSAVRPTDK
jgi:hypothetical protein